MNKQKPLVSIACITYNQEQYIRQCLDGFVMQKTNFNYEIVIHDDASSDLTPSIIREYCAKYPELFVPILQTENKYKEGKGILAPYVFPKCQGKYIALCEGDDYWIDPLKLQKQVDFLEANPEYGMCYSNFNIYFQQTGITWYDNFTKRPDKFPMKYNTPEEFILRKGFVCPPSWLYRKESLPKSTLESLDGTFVLFTHFLCTTKVFVFMDVMATYRVCAESASHSTDYEKLYRRSWNLYTTQCKLIDCYKLDHELKKRCEINFFKENLVQFILHDKKDDIVRAKKVLSGLESARDRILFFLTNVPGGKYLLQLVYYCRSIVR